MQFQSWTVETNRFWRTRDRGITDNPRTQDPDTYLQNNSWFFITHDDFRPEWNHKQFKHGCRFIARCPDTDTSALFRSVVKMWADGRPELQKVEVVAISNDGQLQVWTVRQNENERHQTRIHLNTNRSGAHFIRSHERVEIFHAAYGILDEFTQNHKGILEEQFHNAATEGMSPDVAANGQQSLTALENHLIANAVRTSLQSANQGRPANVLDLHHQRASYVSMILDQHIPERLAAIRADESLPQVLTIISGRGNGSREFGQSPVRSAVIAYLDSHYPAYGPVSRGGAFELSAIDNDLPELTQALSRL